MSMPSLHCRKNLKSKKSLSIEFTDGCDTSIDLLFIQPVPTVDVTDESGLPNVKRHLLVAAQTFFLTLGDLIHETHT